MRSNPSRLLLSTLLLAFTACSHGPVVTEYPSTASAREELTKMNSDITSAHTSQVDVLSPENYAKSVDQFNEAKKMMESGKDDSKVLHELAESRAYLQRANEVAQSERTNLADVVNARTAALTAGSMVQQKEEMSNADKTMRSYGEKFESGSANISQDDRAKLQNEYLTIELNSIKRANLSQSNNDLEKAKKMDAEKWAPRSLATAQEKVRTAEKAIEADRHNQGSIAASVQQANASTATLLRVTELARKTRSADPERMAMGIVGNQNALDQTTSALNSTSTELSKEQTANTALSRSKALDTILMTAQKKFTPEEAEVYRQGDKLLIRLKGLQFTNNSSELRGQSLGLLSKTKDVISQLDPKNVVVEGHTDSVGTQAKNTKLSQDRAETVEKYLVTEKVVNQNQIDAKGFGFSKPIASNKSATGRAQNRRVDIIVTPAMATGTNSNSDSTHNPDNGSVNQ